jgi:hypothetical protein
VVNGKFIRQITLAEQRLTGQPEETVNGGPAAAAFKHMNRELTPEVVHDITMGERTITKLDGPVENGPAAVAQSILTTGAIQSTDSHSGVLDSATISKITEKEKEITGQDDPVKGGPTARAQQHAGEPITSQSLHDITEGENKVTGGERIKGGPTSTTQSELSKSRT